MKQKKLKIPENAKVPERWRKSWPTSPVKLKLPDTLWFVERNDSPSFKHWLDELHKTFPSDLIPLQWVPELVRVSRAGVLKRAKTGKMHVFSFVVTEWEKNLLGKAKQRDSKKQYDYVLKSECFEWMKSLEKRSKH